MSLNTRLGHQLLGSFLLCRNLRNQLLARLALITAKLLQMHLIRSVSNTQSAHVRLHGGKRSVLADTSSAEALHSTVNDTECHVRNRDLGHGNLLLGFLCVGSINLDSSIEDQQ